MTRRRCAVLAVMAGFAMTTAATAQNDGDAWGHLPGELRLMGTVRDFRERTVQGGHPDFERQPTRGFGLYSGMIANELDAEGKPKWAGTGFKTSRQPTDAQGRPMVWPKPYIASRPGDVAGARETAQGGASTDEAAFKQWFRDVPGVNASAPLEITLVRQPGTNRYVFDDRESAIYQNRGGFFPINGQLFGNSPGNDRNFHFTYELVTNFVYKRGAGHVFTFTGDDDVWVYVDGKVVIDVGGVHGRTSQTIDLDRLTWLEDGQQYQLKFYFAERHRTQSNFRIETTLMLRNVEPPATSALAD